MSASTSKVLTTTHISGNVTYTNCFKQVGISELSQYDQEKIFYLEDGDLYSVTSSTKLDGDCAYYRYTTTVKKEHC